MISAGVRTETLVDDPTAEYRTSKREAAVLSRLRVHRNLGSDKAGMRG